MTLTDRRAIDARPRMPAVRQRTRELLEPAGPGDRASAWVDATIISLIALNVLAMILETVPELKVGYGSVFAAFERVSIMVFSAEYLARLWSATARYDGAIRGRIRWARQPMSLIDLLAVLPFWIPGALVDLRALRVFRLFRLARIAKLGRYSRALHMLGRVIIAKKAELVVTLSIGATLLLAASAVIYFAENAAQPEIFSSVPSSMWWAVATLTTVGYGDAYPVSALGRFLGGIVAVMGIGMFALPTGILGAAFVEELERGKTQREGRCGECGRPLDR